MLCSGRGASHDEQALLRLARLTLYVRSPNKLPSDVKTNPLVTIVQGELNDEAKLSSCFTGSQKIDGVISTLGPKVGQPKGNPIAHGYKNLLKKMHEFGVRRLVLLSTVSISAPEDHFSVIRESMVAGIKIIGYSAWTGDPEALILLEARLIFRSN